MTEGSVGKQPLKQDNLLTPKGKSSIVWNYFGFHTDKDGIKDDEKRVVCRLCERSIAFSGNTTNLKQHLQNHHPSVLSSYSTSDESSRRTTLESMAFIPKKKFSAGSKRSLNITDGLVEFISKDMMPISIVEGKGFINFLKILEPQYSLPSRKTITKRLEDKYDQIRASVQMKLDSMPAAALTLDYWTSRATDSYLDITVHCISVDWQMVSYVLETKEVIERHRSENVAEDIKVVVHKWGLTHRIDCITTDNARNIVAAMRLVQWKRHPCFAHTLQLGVKAGLTIPAVANILASCRKIVGHFKHSYLAQNALEKKQERYSYSVEQFL